MVCIHKDVYLGGASKCIQQAMMKQGENLEKSRNIIRNFNFPFSITNRRGRQAENLLRLCKFDNIIRQFNLTLIEHII